MIYTSYFAQLRNLPENIIPVSICGKAPNWYHGYQYKKLAPKYDFSWNGRRTTITITTSNVSMSKFLGI